MLLVNMQRRPSFPQSSSGDWSGCRHKHNNGKPAPTAASMAEMQYEDDEPESVTTPTASSSLQHAPYCRCFVNNTLHVPGDNSAFNSNNNSGSGGGGGGGVGGSGGGGGVAGSGLLPGDPSAAAADLSALCTCQLSRVTLGGVTSPDGSKTALINNNKKPRRPRGAKPTVIFNVGGQTFETYRSTLKRFKNAFFADDDKMRAYFRPAQGDYFFDRDPTAFGCVLNYLRTGELHVPTTMCGPALQTELEFWGIEELDIERCCWTQYNTWKTQSRSLEKLEYDRTFSTTQNLEQLRNKTSSCWGRNKAAMWQFLQDPGSSRGAKAYAWLSIIFVFVSIFSFCADTHPLFRVKANDVGDFADIYRFFNLEFLEIPKDDDKLGNDSADSYDGALGDKRKAGAALSNQTLQASRNESTSALVGGGGGGGKGTGYFSADGGGRDYNETLSNSNSSDGKKKTMGEDKDDLPHPSLLIIDMCCLIFFTLEYITRFMCSPSKVNFLKSFQNVIDFVAISPDYVELLFLVIDPMRREGMAVMDLMFILRMLRLCRIFRLIRHVPGLWILLYTLKASFNELMLMFVFLLIGMVVFATLMHFAEGKNGFPNIPVGFWWSVVTMTTVGYGDMFPQTAAGYVIGSCCAVAGLLMIAFTVPIIVSNFVLYYTHVQYGLARREREMEKLTEEEASPPAGGTADEENPADVIGDGDRSECSDVKVVAGGGGGGDGGGGGGGGGTGREAKVPVDSLAIALGENIALTSPRATKDNCVHFQDETSSRTAGTKGVILV